jgi:transmembrane protein TMEM260 (protein O-mannosyltransferase)
MTEPNRQSPPYGYAALVAAVVLGIYVATLAPTTAFWDTSEYIAAAKTLGIPHPPGNPLFVLLAHAFGLLPLAASYAVRINLFAAVTSALSAGLWFLVAERWLRNIVPDRTLRLGAAAAGVLVGATSWTVWNQSTVNEKVYTVSLLSIALGTWLAVHWGDDEESEHRDRWLVLIAYVLALTSTNHMMGVLAAPALGVYVLWTDWRLITRAWVVLMGWVLLLAVTGLWGGVFTWILGGLGVTPPGQPGGTEIFVILVTLGLALWAAFTDRKNPLLYLGVAAVLVGVSLNYVFLPLRGSQLPPINEGEPTSWQALLDVLNRVQYGKPSVFDLPWPPSGQPRTGSLFLAQLANYWQYFTWQFARDWSGVQAVATAFFAVTGLAGLWTILKKDRRAGIAALAMLGTLTLALVWYLNFKYGFSMYPDRADIDASTMREVRERDYFFICSFAFFGTLIAAGIGAAVQAAVAQLRSRAAALPIFALCLVPLFGNRLTASRSHEFVAGDFARDLLESVEPYGILITAGDNDTFPLWFAQEVEGIRPDVTLANLSLMNTDWHLRQLRRRKTPDFDPSKAFELWKPRADTSGQKVGVPGPQGWVKPTNSVFSQSEVELDSLPEYSRVPKGSGVKFGDLTVTLGEEIVDRKDLAVIFLIRDNLGKRPIYFSWSDGGYPDETLGLTQYLVSQGLVRKLYLKPVEPTANIVLTSMGYTDLERTRALLDKGYRWKSAARQRPYGWVDAPSASILRLYSIVYGGMAKALREHGDSALAARADSVSRLVDGQVRRALPEP